MNTAIFIVAIIFLLAFYLGVRARKGQPMQLEQWAVGGRKFGPLIMFVLMAGELFSTFVFLGGTGAAYRMGGPSIFIFCALTYIIPYWILPPIWLYAKKQRLLTQSDFFAKKYNSQRLGVLVAVVGVISMIPYIVLQLKGLQVIVSEASYGIISPRLAVWLGVIAVTIFVYFSGIYGSAWTAVLKDFLMLAVILFLGIYLPYHYFGGVQPMFEKINTAKPDFLLMPSRGFSTSWYVSTCLTIALGQYMWPHCFGASLAAKDARTLRQNAAILPLYQILLVFILFIGFVAYMQLPHLEGAASDLSLFKIAKQTFAPWFVGVIGAAGLLAALVPCSMLLLSVSTLLAKNIFRARKLNRTDDQIAKLTRYFVPLVGAISLYCTFYGGNTMVSLLIMAYSFVLQLFPPLFFSLWKKNPITKSGAFAGIMAGVAIVAYVTVTGITVAALFPHSPPFIKDLDSGVIAIFCNTCLMIIISAFTKKEQVKGENINRLNTKKEAI